MQPEATRSLNQYRETCLSPDSSTRALPRYNTSMSKVAHPLILKYAEQIARQFRPDRIILFGSYAYGAPNNDSDVDLLVVMPARDRHSQAVRILWRLAAPFPIDLLVRTPKEMKLRLEDGVSFTTTIVTKGKVLYEKNNARMGQKSRSGLRGREAREPKQDSGT